MEDRSYFVFDFSEALIETLETSFRELDKKKSLCNTCGKAMNSYRTLELHAKIHKGIQKHACSSCPRKYNKKIDLENHLRSRHGADPFTCKVCKKTFMNKFNFTRHVKTCGIPGLKAVLPFRCDICSVRCRSTSELKEHKEARHDRVAKYPCVKCGVHYRYRTSLRFHKMKCTSK